MPRMRSDGMICQFKPAFHTLSLPLTELYLKTRAEALAVSDSIPVTPLTSGMSNSTKASFTLSLPLVTSAVDAPHRSL
ncbi:hypothetical protein D3C75_1196750 [compost metagenome]